MSEAYTAEKVHGIVGYWEIQRWGQTLKPVGRDLCIGYMDVNAATAVCNILNLYYELED